MKKITLLIGFTFLTLVPVQAQEFNFGIKGGVNFASISGDYTDDADGRTGFHLGLLAEFPLAEKFSFQPEVLYSAQGMKSEGSETYEGITYSWEDKMNLDYINVPLLAKYYIAPGFNIHAGPQVSFLINAEEVYEGEGETDTEDFEYIKDLDFGLAGGVGYQLDMGLFFNARYNLGLSNILDLEGEEIDEEEEFSWKNNVFQLSVGYMF